jgi:DNA topoisomerase-1
MQIAQKLYQGIEIEGETIGLITYMRTDGTNLSKDAISSFRDLLKMKLVMNIYLKTFKLFWKKSKKCSRSS